MSKEWIVFFGEDWGGLNSTGQYIARKLQNEYNILWVNSIGLREPKFNRYDIKRIFKKLFYFIMQSKSMPSVTSEVDESIFPVTLIAIPYLKYNIIRIINKHILLFFLKKKFKQLNIIDIKIITACPSAADVVDALFSKNKIFYCADEYSELPGVEKKTVLALEYKLYKSVNCVVVTSKALQRKIKQYNNNTVYIPHGVNYDVFSKAKLSEDVYPNDIKYLNHPVIGYFGLIGEHLDYDLLKDIAEHFSNVSFVMVGPIENAIRDKIPHNSNIYYLGPKLYTSAPYYMKSFSISHLPWSDTPRNRYANPTKVREYLASDRQVVATNHPELVDFRDYVYLANNKNEYISKIDFALSRLDSIPENCISDTVKNQTWDDRVVEFKKILN